MKIIHRMIKMFPLTSILRILIMLPLKSNLRKMITNLLKSIPRKIIILPPKTNLRIIILLPLKSIHQILIILLLKLILRIMMLSPKSIFRISTPLKMTRFCRNIMISMEVNSDIQALLSMSVEPMLSLIHSMHYKNSKQRMAIMYIT